MIDWFSEIRSDIIMGLGVMNTILIISVLVMIIKE